MTTKYCESKGGSDYCYYCGRDMCGTVVEYMKGCPSRKAEMEPEEPELTKEEKRELIINVVKDLVSCFMYYDRKEDVDLPRGSIEEAVEDGIISYEEIRDIFYEALKGNG